MRMLVFLLIFAGALLATGAPGASAQESPWTKIYDKPAASIRTLEMFDGRLGLASTVTALLRTEDGGATWAEVGAEGLNSASDFAFADAQRVWRVGGLDRVSRSDDGGLTWTAQDAGTQAFLQSIAVISRDEAWAAGHGGIVPRAPAPAPAPANDLTASDVAPSEWYDSALVHTTDGGATWQSVAALDGYGIFHRVAASGDSVWVVASRCQPGQPFAECPRSQTSLLGTTDGGATWQVLSEEPDFTPLVMSFPNANDGFATPSFCYNYIDGLPDCPSGIWRTADGGETWQQLPGSPAMSHVVAVSATDVWAGGMRCAPAACTAELWRSTDAGQTWTFIAPPGPQLGEFDVTPTHVVSASSPDGISRYDLATASWTASVTPTAPAFWYVDFDPRSNTRGYATAYGAYHVTDDGGRTWRRLPQPAQLGTLHPVADGTVWSAAQDVCAGCPAVFRSTDRGETWQASVTPFTYVAEMDAADANRAWVATDIGLWRTDDAGANWRMLESTPFGTYSFIDREHGYSRVCPPNYCQEQFRYTSDGGETWELRPLPLSDGLTFVTPLVAFATKYIPNDPCADCGSVIIGTTDGGLTWNDLGRAPGYLFGAASIDARTGWMLGQVSNDYGSSVFFTRDGGLTWTEELRLPLGVYASELIIHGDRITMKAGAGGQGLGDHVYLYERTITGSRPPVRPPDAGDGSGAAGGTASSMTLLVLLLATAGTALTSAGIRAQRARCNGGVRALTAAARPLQRATPRSP